MIILFAVFLKMSNFKLVQIGERNGEYEYEWYTIAWHTSTDHEIVLDFYGELDNSDWAKEFNSDDEWWIDAGRTCWIDREYEISDTQRNALRKFGIT